MDDLRDCDDAMRRVNGRPRRRSGSHRDERGAVAIMVALLAVVIFGIAAYVIDISALYQERRELQNGADAAALAIARDCAMGDCGDDYATADEYVDANADDGDANVLAGDITYPTANRVRVRASTADAGDGDNMVDYHFAQVFGLDGRTVSASATAEWFNPGSGSTLPLTFSLCEWNQITNGGDDYAEPPFDDDDPVVINFHEGNGNDGPPDCAAQAGQDTDGDGRLPGGFGWLDSTNCISNVSVDGWVAIDPGNGRPASCTPSQFLDRDIMIPVFDDVIRNTDPGWSNQCSRNRCYHIYGFAVFHVTGFRFPGGNAWRTSPPPRCSGPGNSGSCIEGYFVRLVVGWQGGSGGGPDLGAAVIRLVD